MMEEPSRTLDSKFILCVACLCCANGAWCSFLGSTSATPLTSKRAGAPAAGDISSLPFDHSADASRALSTGAELSYMRPPLKSEESTFHGHMEVKRYIDRGYFLIPS